MRVGFAAANFTLVARLRVEQRAKVNGVGAYKPASQLKSERDAYLACYLGLATEWVIKYPTAQTEFPRDAVAIGLIEPVLILAFIWIGSAWFERHRGRQVREIRFSQ